MEWGPTKVKFIISRCTPLPSPPISGMLQKISEGYKRSNHWQCPRMERGQVAKQPEGREITNISWKLLFYAAHIFKMFFQQSVLHYYYYIIILFNFIRNNFFFFSWSGQVTLLLYQQHMLFWVVPYSCQHLPLLFFSIFCISNGCVVIYHYSF